MSRRRLRAHGLSWLAVLTLVISGCGSAEKPTHNALQAAALSTSNSAARALSRGDLAQARQLYERALASADSVEDFALAGAVLNNLALVHQRAAERLSGAARQTELDTALARLQRVQQAPQRYGGALQAAASTRMALVQLDRGDAAAAARAADAATRACAAPCEHGATLALVRAQLAWQQQDAAGTVRAAEQALALATAAGLANEQANAHRQLGRARAMLGQHAQAAADLAQALVIDQRLGLPERIALDLLWAGDVEAARGQAAAAREFRERALVVASGAGLVGLAERARGLLGRP